MGFEANRLVSDEKEIKEHLRGGKRAAVEPLSVIVAVLYRRHAERERCRRCRTPLLTPNTQPRRPTPSPCTMPMPMPMPMPPIPSAVTQAVEMLQFNVLQGKLNDRGNYSVDIRPEQADFHGGEEKIEISHMDEENTPLEPPPLVTSTSGCKSKAT